MSEMIKQLRDEPALRESFMVLAEHTFGLSFEPWYKGGFWSDRYIPYAMIEDGRVIANASVNRMDFSYHGQKRCYIQIGTVMTDEMYRGRGLARKLLTQIIADWREKCDSIYLFANSTVLDFYPKFGFVRAEEYEYTVDVKELQKAAGTAVLSVSDQNGKIGASGAFVNKSGTAGGFGRADSFPLMFEKLDMECESDRQRLYGCYKSSNPYSELTMEENRGLLMFYCQSFLKDCVYYSKALDAVVIAETDGDTLICYDIFGDGGHLPPAKNGGFIRFLNGIFSEIAQKDTKTLLLGFTPIHKTGLRCQKIGADDALFVLKGKENLFTDGRRAFPLLSHA